MIAGNFVIVPLEVPGIVPYGIGSVRIELGGQIAIIAPNGEFFGREMEEKIRAGKIDSFRLVPHYKELL